MDKNVFEKKIVRQAFLEWLNSGLAADRVLNETLREHRVGAGQRTLAADAFFALIRHKALLVTDPPRTENPAWLRELDTAIMAALSDDSSLLDLHARARPGFDEDPLKHLRKVHGVPEFLVREMAAGVSPWHLFLHQMLSEAPLVLRVNPLKASTEELLKRFAARSPQASAWIPDAILFDRRWAANQEPGFTEGQFEIQDEHSQVVAWAAAPQPDSRVLDLCAGGGGKTLHLAALMGGKGEISAYDLDKRKLVDLSARARRAGLTNVRVCDKMPKREELFDLVVVDAPCSGLGTLRRGPDRLYSFSEDDSRQLARVQNELLERAFGYLKPGGRVVYATCTVRPAENEFVIRRFLEKGRKAGDLRANLRKALGSKTEAFLAQASETPASRIAAAFRAAVPGTWPKELDTCALTLGPSSHPSGGLRGDGFFVALLS